MQCWKLALVLALGSLSAVAGCGSPQPEPEAEEVAPSTAPEPSPAAPELVATALLKSRADTTVHGTVTFTQRGDAVTIVADLAGAAPGLHGFHIHETGDCSAADFTSAGGHFNPAANDHGCPSEEGVHAGDLGNLEIGADGTGRLETTSTSLTVDEGPNSVVERAVVFHEAQDDCVTQPTGAAGGRAACGVITLGTTGMPAGEDVMEETPMGDEGAALE